MTAYSDIDTDCFSMIMDFPVAHIGLIFSQNGNVFACSHLFTCLKCSFDLLGEIDR